MKTICLIFLLLCSYLPVALAQDAAALLKEAHRLEVLMNEKAAFEKIKEALKLQPGNINALNKSSELCSRIGKREATPEKREAYYTAAKNYAAAALRLSPNNAEAHCVMAIALGRTSLNHSGKEKINAAKEIKKHVDQALALDPLNYKAWHVLGRWHYELSNLNMFERAAVRLLFGSLPASSFAESVKAFEKAGGISKNFILNYYEMAKAYKKNSQKQHAIAALRTLQQLPNQTEDDEQIKAEARQLLNDWL
ncbi:MAG: hypothetical protein RL172_33 [Bacteroidota bacterium]|jgi:tetratricopeptide (TPR) repeat protein